MSDGSYGRKQIREDIARLRREQRETDAWVRAAHVMLWPTFVFTMVNFVLLMRRVWE